MKVNLSFKLAKIFFLLPIIVIVIFIFHITNSNSLTAIAKENNIIVNNIPELINSNVSLGDIVITKGFYEPNDNGNAKYSITDSPLYPLNTSMSFSLVNGLYANLLFDESTILNVACFGILPDTIIPESVNTVLKILDNRIAGIQFNDGSYYFDCSVYLTSTNYYGTGQTYLCVAPNFKTDFFGIFTTDYLNNKTSISLNNLKFSYTPDPSSVRFGRQTCLVYLDNISKCVVDNCSFYSNTVSGYAFTPTDLLWVKSQSLDSLTITNSEFYNATGESFVSSKDHYAGGCLWVSGKSKEYTNFLNNISISGCKFSTTVTDEAVAFWSGAFSDINIQKCIFDFYGNVFSDNIVAFHNGLFVNSNVINNTFNINGKCTRVLKCLDLKDASYCNIENNTININNNNDVTKAREIVQFIDDNVTASTLVVSSNTIHGNQGSSYESFVTLKNVSNKHLVVENNSNDLLYTQSYTREINTHNSVIDVLGNTISNSPNLNSADNASSVEFNYSE